MIRRRNFLFLTVAFFLIFIFTTNYLLTVLVSSEIEVKKILTIEEKIYLELEKFPERYNSKSPTKENYIESFLENVKNATEDSEFTETDLVNLWKEVNSWVSKTQILNFSSSNLGNVLSALRTAKIVKADVDTRGTQLKLLLTLQGNQQVIFKPQWYDKTALIEGPVYAGRDRHGSEIVGFFLSVILKKPLTPISVERRVTLKNEIIPVATRRLLDTFFNNNNNKTCFYGKCFFCRKEDAVCGDDKSNLNGAVIFNLGINLSNHRSPWQRTYKKGKNAIWQDFPEVYCKTVKEKISRKRLYDLIDLSIFDFLIQNGDRHHYETFGDTVIWLDNGKGLGNPFIHHLDILAPLYQCCMLRRETWKTLSTLTGGELREKLLSMPGIDRVITEDHLKAIEERLKLVLATIYYCKNKSKQNSNFI